MRSLTIARIYKKTKTKGFFYYFTIELGKDNTGKRNRIKRVGFTKRKDVKKATLELEATCSIWQSNQTKYKHNITLFYVECLVRISSWFCKTIYGMAYRIYTS